jgi:hypothetical protein
VKTKAWKHPAYAHATFHGTPAKGYTEVKGGVDNESYNGKNGADYRFTSGGKSKALVYTPYDSLHAVGSAATSCSEDASGNASAKMEYGIGAWDGTAHEWAPKASKKDEATHKHESESIGGNDSKKIDTNKGIKDGTFAFNAQPNHSYYVCFWVEVEGDSYRGSSQAEMKVYCGRGLQIIFP